MIQQYNKENFKKLLLQIVNEENYKEILNTIFEISMTNKNIDIADIIENLNESFGFDCVELIKYLSIPGYLTKDDINIYDSGIIKFINLLKKKYGYIIRKILITEREPFMVTKFSSNFQPGMSYASIKIERNDGENIEGISTAQNFLALTTFINNTTLSMIKNGVYNLDLVSVDNSIHSMKNLIDVLETLKDSKKRENE